VSFFKYLFDNDQAQRDDIDELRETQLKMMLSTPTGASEKWVAQLARETKELAATVTVLMRKLHEAKLLDIAAVQAEVAEELEPKRKAKQAKAPRPQGPITDETCTKCGTTGTSDQMVKVGSAWYCRPCARNP
jgi:hypothetical protein